MATKVVHFSDLSGREAEDEGQLGRLVVLEHPDIGEPATLEVFPDEVADLQSAERLVRLEYYAPGERRAQQLTVTADQFNALVWPSTGRLHVLPHDPARNPGHHEAE